jgi:ubiquinone/menaquinone biosynthesis C-methylase UbiE
MEFCTSVAWRDLLEEAILPGALDGAGLGSRIVEVGPGPGFTTDILCRTGASVTAVEIDPTLADQLRERMAGQPVEVIVGDARETGLPGDSFTGAASFHMLHHVAIDDDQDAIFAELFRILTPGGRIVVADGFDSEGVRQFHIDDVYNPIDPESLPTRLGAVGFAEIAVAEHELGWYCRAVVPLDANA